MVGLADRADDRVGEYSGGMQRRCNIAVGLFHEPKLLVLDEPTVGVDPQSRNQILDSIEALGGAGLSVLYTTHYMEQAERLCDRIGIMDTGHMSVAGTDPWGLSCFPSSSWSNGSRRQRKQPGYSYSWPAFWSVR